MIQDKGEIECCEKKDGFCTVAHLQMLQVGDDIITCDSKVCHGKACISGTRIPVHVILEKLANGYNLEQICGAYENISISQIKVAISFAAIILEDYKPLGSDE